MSKLELKEVTVDGQPARVHVGGQGTPLLLVHGAWGGAATHWGPVWEKLAERFQVIAPELPGIGWMEQPALASPDGCVRWLEGVLDALGVSRAWCVGNSFGASVAWVFAASCPGRCQGLVLVNGGPPPPMPALALKVMRLPGVRGALRAISKRAIWNEKALERAFADPKNIPTELREAVRPAVPRRMQTVLNIISQPVTRARPDVKPLIVWGEQDRLTGSDVSAGRKLHASLPGSRFELIPQAGHLPQVENPEAFVRAVESFISAQASSPSRG